MNNYQNVAKKEHHVPGSDRAFDSEPSQALEAAGLAIDSNLNKGQPSQEGGNQKDNLGPEGHTRVGKRQISYVIIRIQELCGTFLEGMAKFPHLWNSCDNSTLQDKS